MFADMFATLTLAFWQHGCVLVSVDSAAQKIAHCPLHIWWEEWPLALVPHNVNKRVHVCSLRHQHRVHVVQAHIHVLQRGGHVV